MSRLYQPSHAGHEVLKQLPKINFTPNSPCPCNSGRSLGACHLDIDGKIRKPPPNLRPPGTRTGFAHPGCYLAATHDCSEEISKEHYISRSVLEQLGAVLAVSGAHWVPPGESFETTINNLTAKILCRRHNEALSPLDQEAGLFFAAWTETLKDLERKTLSRKPGVHLIGGDTLELWMLKVACGLYFGVGTKDRERLIVRYSADLNKIQNAFFDHRWDPRGGFYFQGALGSKVQAVDNVSITSLTDDQTMLFAGAVISLRGLTLQCLFDTTNVNPGSWVGLWHRPSDIVLQKGPRMHSIIMTWPAGTPTNSVRLAALGPRTNRVQSTYKG